MTTLRSPTPPGVPPLRVFRSGSKRLRRGKDTFRLLQIVWLLTVASCGGAPATDPHYPPRPEGCDVKVFYGKVAGIVYDNIGRVDSICSNDLGIQQCILELKKQTCKLGGDIVYDVPSEPDKPSPDKMRLTGHVAHTRIAGAR